MFRRLDDQEADQVVAWRPPALERPTDPHDAVRAALQAAGLHGGFQIAERHTGRSAASPVTVQTNEELASLLASELNAEQPPTAEPASASEHELELAPPAPAQAPSTDEAFEAGAGSVRESLGEAVASVVRAFVDEHDRWKAERDREVVALASALAEAILRRELTTDPALLERLVRETLTAFEGETSRPSVQLHPLDLHALEAIDGGAHGIELIAEASLQRGDCRVKSGAGLIEAGVTDRLRALLAEEASIGEQSS